MIPVVSLVGRPNVGKSTLFNRITGTQDALVADFPGLTRDRLYGSAFFNKKPFIVIDTGGIGVEDAAVDELMLKQSSLALDESEIILFLVDAKAGLTSVDLSIAERLRKLNKTVFLIINKAENISSDLACSEFQSLGFSAIYAISATHNRGVTCFLQDLTAKFEEPEEIESDNNDALKIAFIGRPNVGKSTLINRLLGEERVVVYDMPGTTRDSISIPFSRNDKNYNLIDTAGIRRRSRVDGKIEKFSIIKTLQAIKSSHVCLMLIDAKEGLTEQDMHLLSFIIDAGKGLVVAVNKWDNLSVDHKEQIRSELDRRLHFISFARMSFISALYGSGVGLLFKDIDEAYKSATLKLSTPHLTRLLQDITAAHEPPLVNGRRIKLRYAHAGGHNPPIIVIHGNQLQSIPDSYKRYMQNAFVAKLNLVGTPLKLEFKTNVNPFKGKKNVLTERQIKRKKRLMKHVKSRKK